LLKKLLVVQESFVAKEVKAAVDHFGNVVVHNRGQRESRQQLGKNLGYKSLIIVKRVH
jgi:hypothetical protein